MTRLKQTEVEKVIALADGRRMIRNAKAMTGHNKSDASSHAGKKKRDAFWRRLENFKDIEDRCRQRRGRSWLYRYLSAVFRFRDHLKSWQERELVLCCANQNPQHRGGYDEFRILIDITSKADRKSRSRWTQALRYAYDCCEK
mgnify:CR=1 FL=1